MPVDEQRAVHAGIWCDFGEKEKFWAVDRSSSLGRRHAVEQLNVEQKPNVSPRKCSR